MPTYICRTPTGLLIDKSKMDLAEAITRVHAGVTGSESIFVQVLFREISAADCFIGGKALAAAHCFIQGHIRAGRSAIERADLIRGLVPEVCEILGVARYAVWIYLSELPPRAMSEFGHILSEPGERRLGSRICQRRTGGDFNYFEPTMRLGRQNRARYRPGRDTQFTPAPTP